MWRRSNERSIAGQRFRHRHPLDPQLHDLICIVTFAMFIIHFYPAVVHPMMWQSLVSMRYGVVSESYARAHHAMWYYGKKRAVEMWERERAEAKH